MKSGSSVRRPSLVNSNKGGASKETSVGDVLRKAKRDLFFSRCLFGILLVVIITLIAILIYSGYLGLLVDRILAFME